MSEITKSHFQLFCEKHFIAFDTLSALVYSTLIYSLLPVNHSKLLVGVCDKDFLLAFLSTYVSLCGFLITALAILISFQDGVRIKLFRERNTFKDVFSIFSDALFWLCGLIIAGVILLVFTLSSSQSRSTDLIVAYMLIGIALPIFKVRRAIWILRVMFDLSLKS